MGSPSKPGNIPVAQLSTPDYSIKARGSNSNLAGRYAKNLSYYEEALQPDLAETRLLKTQVSFETARSIISSNSSPDIHFNKSLNPYRGCEHGCSYCFARPTHSYLDLSPGLDFESKLFVKENAPQLLVEALAKPGYRCEMFALGVNTDCYQPIEKQYQITRRILEICLAFKQPVSIVTKGALLQRDMDLLTQLNERNLVSVAISVTTLNNELKAIMEPRAAAVQVRMELVRQLVARNIPVSVLIAPVIPKINDNELEHILEAVAEIGVKRAGYVMLRLPHELTELFSDWLHQHFPLRAEAVLNTMRALHSGHLYQSQFGLRQKGSGQFADLIQHRFKLALKQLNLNSQPVATLNTTSFKVPQNLEHLLTPLPWQRDSTVAKNKTNSQMSLF